MIVEPVFVLSLDVVRNEIKNSHFLITVMWTIPNYVVKGCLNCRIEQYFVDIMFGFSTL